MVKSDLCDYKDAYIVLKRKIAVERDNDVKTRNKNLIFKNNATFRSLISKINNPFIDNAEDLDIILPMYNLLKHRGNYFETSGSLWNYYRGEINDDTNLFILFYFIFFAFISFIKRFCLNFEFSDVF